VGRKVNFVVAETLRLRSTLKVRNERVRIGGHALGEGLFSMRNGAPTEYQRNCQGQAGSLMYATIGTRFDLSFVEGTLTNMH